MQIPSTSFCIFLKTEKKLKNLSFNWTQLFKFTNPCFPPATNKAVAVAPSVNAQKILCMTGGSGTPESKINRQSPMFFILLTKQHQS